MLGFGALRNRNVIPQGGGKGVAVIYQWTELGLRMLLSFRAATSDRTTEMAAQIASVPDDAIPPQNLRDFPQPEPQPESTKSETKTLEATAADTPAEAATG